MVKKTCQCARKRAKNHQTDTPGKRPENARKRPETPGKRPEKTRKTPGKRPETPGKRPETPGNARKTPGNAWKTPRKRPRKRASLTRSEKTLQNSQNGTLSARVVGNCSFAVISRLRGGLPARDALLATYYVRTVTV